MPYVSTLARRIGWERIMPVLLIIAACHATTTALLAKLSRLVLTPHTISVAAGATHQFEVSGVWSDGSTTAPPVTYSATGGTITTAGLYTAGNDTGTYRVIAAQQDGTLADTSAVTIAVLTQVILTPSTVNLAGGAKQQFAVSGVWSDGSTTAPPVTYTATGGTITTAGLYTAGSDTGTFRVIAVQQGGTLADTSVVAITRTLTQVVLTPATASITPSATFKFAVSGVWTDGTTTAPSVTYTATGGTITAAGLYTAGIDTGTFRVIAVQQGGTLADTSVVTISQYPHLLSGLTVLGAFNGSPRDTLNHAFGFSWMSPWHWNAGRTEDDALAVIDDPTNPAPAGSGKVLRFNWNPAYDPGSARTDASSFTSGPYSTLYVMLRIYYEADNWDNTGHKFFYIGMPTFSSALLYTTRETNGGGKVTSGWGTPTTFFNLPAHTLTDGAWLNIEWVFHAQSAPGVSDGAIEMYINGSLVGSASGINMEDRKFGDMEWYATNNSIDTVKHYRIGELYIAAK